MCMHTSTHNVYAKRQKSVFVKYTLYFQKCVLRDVIPRKHALAVYPSQFRKDEGMNLGGFSHFIGVVSNQL